MRSRGADGWAGLERDLIEAGLNEPRVAGSGYGDFVVAPISGSAWWAAWRWPEGDGAMGMGLPGTRWRWNVAPGGLRRNRKGCAVWRDARGLAPDRLRPHGRGVQVIGPGALTVAHGGWTGRTGGTLGSGRVSMTRMVPPHRGQRLRSTPVSSRTHSR